MVNALPPAAEGVGQRGVDADGERGKNREEEGALFHGRLVVWLFTAVGSADRTTASPERKAHGRGT